MSFLTYIKDGFLSRLTDDYTPHIQIFLTLIILLITLNHFTKPPKYSIKGKHVLITGGSSGIGLEVAMKCAEQGARLVTIMARTKDGPNGLDMASKRIELHAGVNDDKMNKICIPCQCDITNGDAVLQAVRSLPAPVDVLFNCAGFAELAVFEKMPLQIFKRLMDVNYLGAVNVTHACIPMMKQQGHGRIVFVSSAAGQIGLYGMCGYSASKYALRGMAEALAMECQPYNNLKVTCCFPPDTKTPGYEKENENKPELTRIMCESGGCWEPEVVASRMVQGAMNGEHQIGWGLEGCAIGFTTAGCAPAASLFEGIPQILVASVGRFVALCFNLYCNFLVRSHGK